MVSRSRSKSLRVDALVEKLGASIYEAAGENIAIRRIVKHLQEILKVLNANPRIASVKVEWKPEMSAAGKATLKNSEPEPSPESTEKAEEEQKATSSSSTEETKETK